ASCSRRSSATAARPVRQAAHECDTGLDLLQLDIFIWLVSLIDGTGAANHGREARSLKEPSFGCKGYRRAFVGAGQPPDQGFGSAILFLSQWGNQGHGFGLDPGFRCKLPQAGQDFAFAIVLEELANGARILAWQIAVLPEEAAFRGQDIDRGSPFDQPDLDGRPGWFETRVPLLSLLFAKAPEIVDQATRSQNGAGTAMRLAGMSRAADHARAKKIHSLVPGHQPHGGGFADDDQTRRREVRHDILDHAGDPQAADFLVVGHGDVDRPTKRPCRELRRQGHRDGQEGFHVGGAAAIEAAVPLRHDEGVAAPALALNRHDIAVAGQDDTARYLRTDGGEKISLGAFLVHCAPAARAVRGEVAFRPVDQRQIRALGDGGETDEPCDQLPGIEAFPTHDLPLRTASLDASPWFFARGESTAARPCSAVRSGRAVRGGWRDCYGTSRACGWSPC